MRQTWILKYPFVEARVERCNGGYVSLRVINDIRDIAWLKLTIDLREDTGALVSHAGSC